jgi:hypothetical protein
VISFLSTHIVNCVHIYQNEESEEERPDLFSILIEMVYDEETSVSQKAIQGIVLAIQTLG